MGLIYKNTAYSPDCNITIWQSVLWICLHLWCLGGLYLFPDWENQGLHKYKGKAWEGWKNKISCACSDSYPVFFG